MSVTLAGRYRLGDKIASGGMGTVFEAIDEKLDRKVAVKILKEELSSDPRFVERFRREARAAAALMHPNIAAVYDYGIDGERHFIVMEFVDGRDLSRLLEAEGSLAPERAAFIGSQIAAALDHAHKAGVVHRDVKPGNVIVSADRVKVTDFGIARAAGDSTLTATGTMLGTAHYISPEQAAGQPATAASDIYAAGVVVFEMLTGSRPFEGESPIAVAMKHATGELPPPSSVNPRVSKSFDEVIARATAKDPATRFRDAGEFGSALVAAPVRTEALNVDSGDTRELQSVWPIPGDRWNPERIGRIVVLSFLALAVVAGALLGYRLTHNDNAKKSHAASGKSASSHRAAVDRSSTSPSPQLVAIPEDVIGLTYEDASARLLSRGLRVKAKDVSSDEVDVGHVVSTDPPPGTVVPAGQTVTVLVSNGEEHGHGPPHVPPGHEKHGKEKEHD